MQDLSEWLKSLWYSSCGLHYNFNETKYEEIVSNIRSHWLPFLKLQFNRLLIGGFRYGLIGTENKCEYNRISRITEDLRNYELTGNDEYLVDISNHAFLEYVEGTHPTKHFMATDDCDHTKVRL